MTAPLLGRAVIYLSSFSILVKLKVIGERIPNWESVLQFYEEVRGRVDEVHAAEGGISARIGDLYVIFPFTVPIPIIVVRDRHVPDIKIIMNPYPLDEDSLNVSRDVREVCEIGRESVKEGSLNLRPSFSLFHYMMRILFMITSWNDPSHLLNSTIFIASVHHDLSIESLINSASSLVLRCGCLSAFLVPRWEGKYTYFEACTSTGISFYCSSLGKVFNNSLILSMPSSIARREDFKTIYRLYINLPKRFIKEYNDVPLSRLGRMFNSVRTVYVRDDVQDIVQSYISRIVRDPEHVRIRMKVSELRDFWKMHLSTLIGSLEVGSPIRKVGSDVEIIKLLISLFKHYFRDRMILVGCLEYSSSNLVEIPIPVIVHRYGRGVLYIAAPGFFLPYLSLGDKCLVVPFYSTSPLGDDLPEILLFILSCYSPVLYHGRIFYSLL